MGLKKKENSLRPLKIGSYSPDQQISKVNETIELDMIQCLRNNIKKLQQSQERVEFLNRELSRVLNYKDVK